jgi:hypothetical protein
MKKIYLVHTPANNSFSNVFFAFSNLPEAKKCMDMLNSTLTATSKPAYVQEVSLYANTKELARVNQ